MAEFDAIPERYEVLGELATGAQGVVLRARDRHSGSAVAIKQFSIGARTAYLRELAASLDNRHDNLLTPLDTFYGADGVGFVVYEFLEAGTLRQAMTPGKPFASLLILRCAEDLLKALVNLHDRKLIHCDIKPENIFVRHNAQGQMESFLLGDLGSTCSIREAEEGDYRSGSPAYTAPERFYQKFQPNSDLYSLGVLLFELASGNLPFIGGPKAMARAHLQQPVPLNQIQSSHLRTLIGGLMEKEPSRRIGSAKRALQMLNPEDAVQGPSNLPISNADLRTPVNKPTQKQANIGRRPPIEVASTIIESGFARLHIASVGDKPLLLVESSTDLATLALAPQSRPRLFPKSGNARLLGTSELLYQVESSINLLNLSSGANRVLHDRCVGAIDFTCDGQRLLWRTRRSAHRIDLETRAESSFLLAHYLLDARSHLLPSGSFAVSTGAMNNQIALRSSDGTAKAVHELDGPVIEIVNDLETLLALTLNVNQADSLTLWRISEYSKPQRLDVPTGSRFFATTPGHIFWLDNGTQIVQCGIGLAPREVFRAGESIDGFAISPDHAWLATWSNLGDNVSRVRVYSAANANEAVSRSDERSQLRAPPGKESLLRSTESMPPAAQVSVKRTSNPVEHSTGSTRTRSVNDSSETHTP